MPVRFRFGIKNANVNAKWTRTKYEFFFGPDQTNKADRTTGVNTRSDFKPLVIVLLTVLNLYWTQNIPISWKTEGKQEKSDMWAMENLDKKLNKGEKMK